MKLEVKNIGLIREAEIELDGVTVLAGFNGTGKSTVSKSLYGIMAGYENLPQRIASERKNSVRAVMISYLDLIFMDAFKYGTLGSDSPLDRFFTSVLSDLCVSISEKRVPVPESYEAFSQYLKDCKSYIDARAAREKYPLFAQMLKEAVNRPEGEYAKFILNRDVNRVFEGQSNTLDNSGSGEIFLSRRETAIFLRIENKKVVSCSNRLFALTTPVYLEPRHMLDISGTASKTIPYDQTLRQLLSNGGSDETDEGTVTFEQAMVREKMSSLIDSVIHGKLVIEPMSGVFQFKDDRFGEPVAVRNMASGSKTFAVLRRLVEQGALRENGTLIIDEPENNLHPEWQIKLAEVLVMLQKELNLRILINTHSTYLLRGIEVASRRHGLADVCHYYKTEPAGDGLFRTVCVDENTNLIYHEFYMPLKEL